MNRWAVATVLVAAVALAAVGVTLALTLPANGGSDQVTLRGVPPEDVQGWAKLSRPTGMGQPVISADDAFSTASRFKPDSAALETLLVKAVSQGEPSVEYMAWAVNFDPSTVQDAPPSCPAFGDCPRWCGHPLYDVTFIDARTGDFIFEMQRDALNASESAENCPEPSYPPPTQVPGQETSPS